MKHLACCAALCCLLLSFAQADETLDELLEMDFAALMDYEVVTPTRTAIKLSDAPGSVTVITYDQIRKSTAQTIPELLRSVAGFNVRWNPMVQTIDVRGFGANPFTAKVLLMIDGVPYNSWNKGGFPQHPGFDFFNLANVKHLEIVRGPGSALYGENAYAGVVNIVTLSGASDGSVNLSALQGDRDTRLVNGSWGHRFNDDTNLFVSGRLLRSQLPMDLWTDADSQANGYDLFIKGIKGRWQATYYRLSDEFDGFEYPLSPAAFPAGSVIPTADKIEQQVDIFGLQFDHESADERWTIKANASHARRNGSHCAACHAPAQRPNFVESEDHGYQNYLHTQVGFNGLQNHELLAGFEVRRIAAGDHDHELDGASHSVAQHDDAVLSYNKASFFLQDRMLLLEDRLQVVAGVRFEGETSPDLFGREVFPRLSSVFKATERVTLRAGWGRAARYPSFSEIYQDTWFLQASTPGATFPLAEFEPNPELGPEQIESFDLGIETRLGRRTAIKLDLFRNEIENHIAIAFPAIRFENHPQTAIVSGAELDLKYKIPGRFSGYFNYAYQHNERRGNGTDSAGQPLDLSYAPRHKINAGVVYTPVPDLTLTLDASWKDEYRAPAFWYPIALGTPEVTPLDAYTLLNLKARYVLPMRVDGRRPFSISLVAKNLGNERPYETLTGLGGRIEGREVFFSLEYRSAD